MTNCPNCGNLLRYYRKAGSIKCLK
ncbi:MAG: hypothetical protein EG826_16520 [Deltaproteobacteria bacterium]|nr:hypothetical protein [Deltaproteobacteria bacterium]